VWKGLKYQMYLGNDEFIESMQYKLGDLKKEQLLTGHLKRIPSVKMFD